MRGHTKHGDIFIENTHEPVISEDDYYRVIDVIENRTHRSKTKHLAIFRGVIQCPQCGSKLHLYAGTIKPKMVSLTMYVVICAISAIVTSQ